MALIITATDFSTVAENAAVYACGLAQAQQASVVVIHSYMIPAMFSDIPMPPAMIDEAQSDSEAQMAQLVAKLQLQFAGLSITATVVYGDIIDAVNEYTAAQSEPWLVVVGNSSLDEGLWPDSNLVATLTQLAYPVLAVPAVAVFSPVKKICFAFDNRHSGNEQPLNALVQITQALAADLLVLNAQAADTSDAAGNDIDEQVMLKLAALHPSYYIQGGVHDVDQVIELFIESNGIDWVVMIPRKHSFFQGLFHRSHTRAVANHTHIPILALPDAANEH